MIKTLILQTTFGQIFYSKETFFGADAGDSDISLTAGLISAIYSMTEETQDQKIEEIALEDVVSVFRELPGEKLFIITVDKRMDSQDSAELLQDIIDGFDAKYGDDMQTDGLILNDFEFVVDEIVAKKLWYNTVPKKITPPDYLVYLTLLFSFFWYPFFLLQGQTTIVDKILTGLNKGFVYFLLESVIILMKTVLPILINILLLNKYPNMKYPFRYMMEFLKRPTRGGYAELLPFWFTSLPVLLATLIFSVIRYGRGMVHAFTVEVFHDNLVYRRFLPDGSIVFWPYITLFIIIYFLVWFLVPPILVGLITGNLDKEFIKSSLIVASISGLLLVPGHILAGNVVQNLLGYDTSNLSSYSAATTSLKFIFTVTFPVNIFIAANIFFQGVGLSPLIKKNRSRFTVAFGISIFAAFQILDFFWWLIFYSGKYFVSFID